MGNYKHQLTSPIIQREYVQGCVEVSSEGDRFRYFPSIEQLAEKYNVPAATLQTWSVVKGWANLRQQFQERQNSELLEESAADWYRQEQIRSDALMIAATKKLMSLLRADLQDFEEQRSLLEELPIPLIEKHGRILSGWAKTLKDIKVGAELALTNKDGSIKTLGEGVGRSTDEIEKELQSMMRRLGDMR